MGDVVLDVEQREQPGRIVEAFQPADMVGRMFEQPGARLGKTGGGIHPNPIELGTDRSEEHTSELQSLMRISYAVFCFKQQINSAQTITIKPQHTCKP